MTPNRGWLIGYSLRLLGPSKGTARDFSIPGLCHGLLVTGGEPWPTEIHVQKNVPKPSWEKSGEQCVAVHLSKLQTNANS